MSPVKAREVTRLIERLAPLELAEDRITWGGSW